MDRPVRLAGIIAGSFLVVSVLYIAFSDWIVLKMTDSLELAGRIQFYKGLTYVILVGIGLFALSYFLLERLRKKTAEARQSQEALLSAKRKTMAGTLASSFAHDARGLVTVIEGNLKMLIDHNGKDLTETSQQLLGHANDAAEDLNTLTERLRNLGKESTGVKSDNVDFSGLIKKATMRARSHFKLEEHPIETQIQEDVAAPASPNLVLHATLNLLLNAAEATSADGHILVSLNETHSEVILTVEDNGPGIPEQKRESLLAPFATTKPDGTGLGLFSVAYCVDAHRGELEIGESHMGGAKFELAFPKRPSECEPDATDRTIRPTVMEPA